MSLLRTTPLQYAPRLTAGLMILSAGLDKLHPDPEHAAGVHGMATGAYPVLEKVPAQQFTHRLAQAELALGAALVAPVVPPGAAGAGLTAFAAGLLGMYAKLPGMRREDGVRPTQQGNALAKDVWLLGIGLGLVGDALAARRRH